MPNPFGNPLSLPNGRPKKHPVERRTERVSCYLDGQERAMLRSAAMKLNTTEAKLLRQAAIELSERILAGHARALPEPMLYRKKRQQRKDERMRQVMQYPENTSSASVSHGDVTLPFPVRDEA